MVGRQYTAADPGFAKGRGRGTDHGERWGRTGWASPLVEGQGASHEAESFLFIFVEKVAKS